MSANHPTPLVNLLESKQKVLSEPAGTIPGATPPSSAGDLPAQANGSTAAAGDNAPTAPSTVDAANAANTAADSTDAADGDAGDAASKPTPQPARPVFSMPKTLPKLSAPANGAASASALWNDTVARLSSPLTATVKAVKSRARSTLTLANVDDVACRKTIAEVRRVTKASLETSRSSSGSTTFVITGPAAEVEKARAVVQRNHAPHVNRRIEVPSSARSTIIGPRGQNLFKITDSTFTKINVGQPNDASSAGSADAEAPASDGWSLPTIFVDISGTTESVASAAKMIIDQVGSRMQTVTASRVVPLRLVPFLARFAEAAPLPTTHKVKVYPESGVITVTGPIEGGHAVRAAVDAEILRISTICVNQQIPEQHQRLTGVLARDALFNKHGVVIDDTMLFGPPASLSSAARDLSARLSSLAMDTLDISRAHNRDLIHAQHLARYFESQRSLHENISELGVTYTLSMTQTDANTGSVIYAISGENAGNVKEARRRLVRLVSSLPPTSVLSLPAAQSKLVQARMDKLVRSAVEESKNTLVQVNADKYGSDSFVVHESAIAAQDDDFGPSQAILSSELAALAVGLEPLLQLDTQTISRTVEIPVADHRHVREPHGIAKGNLHALLSSPGEGENVPRVILRYGPGAQISAEGLAADVDALIEALPTLVLESKDYQQRASFTDSVRVEPKSVPSIIGRQGATIAEVMDKFHVNIEAERQNSKPSGLLTVRGLEANVKKAVKHLAEMDARLQDETSIEIKVPTQYHAMIIGTKGRNTKRFREKQGVHLRFPPGSGPRHSAEGASEEATNSPDEDSSPVSADLIVLRGPSKAVQAVAQEIQDLVEYERAHSQQKTITVPADSVRSLTGKQGTTVMGITEATGARINIGRRAEGVDEVEVVVIGTAAAVKAACTKIQETVAAALDRVEKSIPVDQRYLRYLRGPETRDAIFAAAGADPLPGSGHILAIPSMQSKNTDVRIIGPAKIVEALEREVNKIIDSKASTERATVEIEVPATSLGSLIGMGGSTKRRLEQELHISIDVPAKRDNSAKVVSVTLRGPDDKTLDAAKDHILNSLRASRAELRLSPRLAALASSHGTFLRELEESFGVRALAMGGKGDAGAATAEDQVPALNDAALRNKQYYFATAPLLKTEREGAREVVWQISGRNDELVAKALEAAQKRVEIASNFDTAGFVWFSRPQAYAAVIGTAGMTVNAVRRLSGCYIDVPKRNGPSGSPIIIRGSKQQVERAQALLLDEAGLQEARSG